MSNKGKPKVKKDLNESEVLIPEEFLNPKRYDINKMF
jgi:hypothetical protein